MSKQTEVERAAARYLNQANEKEGAWIIMILRDAGYVLCGPDECPMPREPIQKMLDANAERDEWCNSEGQAPQPLLYKAHIEWYQRERSAEQGAGK